MSAQNPNTSQGRSLKKSALLCGAGVWALHALDPFYTYGVNIVAWGAGLALVVSVPKLTSAALRRVADMMDHAAAWIPNYIKGTASWSYSPKEIKDHLLKPSLFKTGHGAFWGCYKPSGMFGLFRQPIVTALPPVSVVFGKTGSGKGILHQQINMLSIPGSKFIVDFDGTETAMMADALRKKGERVIILNLDDKYSDILGESDCFNPLDHIIDCFEKGCITDVWSDVVDVSKKLYPEPKGAGDSEGGGANIIFRDGSRDLIRLAILLAILLHGRNATMAHVLRLLQNRAELLQQCLWMCGELEQADGTTAQMDLSALPWASRHSPDDLANFTETVANLARSTADQLSSNDTRTFDSFLTGALQKLIHFNPGTRSSKKLQRSTFQFAEQKDEGQDTSVFIVLDNSKLEAQQDILSLIVSIAQKEWIRHPNAGKKLVTLFLNEINNWTYPGLLSALSWIRKFGLRAILYCQNYKSFDRRYGDGASDILKSEAGISLFLPEGLSEPDVLDHLEKTLGQSSYVTLTHNGKRDGTYGLGGYAYSEDAGSLLNADQVRRLSKHGILIIGSKRPIKTYLTSISRVARLRRMPAIHPLHGKPFIQPIRLWLLRYEPWMPANILAKRKARRLRAKLSSKKGEAV